MKNKVIKLSVLSLALTTGLILAPLSYADNCNTPAYQALSKLKNSDVLSRINELNLTSVQKSQFKVMKSTFDAESKKNGDAGKAMNVQGIGVLKALFPNFRKYQDQKTAKTNSQSTTPTCVLSSSNPAA